MMHFISHRGNLSGTEPDRENTPSYIDEAIEAGYDVEIDVRFYKNNFYLGHDEVDPEKQVYTDEAWFLDRKDSLWIHAKDLEALYHLMRLDLHTFTHNRDPATITNQGHVWTHPGRRLYQYSIEVMPERYRKDWYLNLGNVAGICSDHIGIFSPKKFEDLSNGRKTTFALKPGPIHTPHPGFSANNLAEFAAAYGGWPFGHMG